MSAETHAASILLGKKQGEEPAGLSASLCLEPGSHSRQLQKRNAAAQHIFRAIFFSGLTQGVITRPGGEGPYNLIEGGGGTVTRALSSLLLVFQRGAAYDLVLDVRH